MQYTLRNAMHLEPQPAQAAQNAQTTGGLLDMLCYQSGRDVTFALLRAARASCSSCFASLIVTFQSLLSIFTGLQLSVQRFGIFIRSAEGNKAWNSGYDWHRHWHRHWHRLWH